MMGRTGINTVHAVWLCCVAFAAGYFSATAQGGESGVLCFPETANAPASACSCDVDSPGVRQELVTGHKKKLETYVIDLITTTIETEVLQENKDADYETLRKLFHTALIHALAIENFKCEPKSVFVSKHARPCPTLLPTTMETSKPLSLSEKRSRQRRIPSPVERAHQKRNLISGIAMVDRAEFNSIIDTGIPFGMTTKPDTNALVFYGTRKTQPSNKTLADMATYAETSAKTITATRDALQNCDQLSVIHISRSSAGKCWVFLPGEESFHIQKWVRIASMNETKTHRARPFRMVSRGYDTRYGIDYPSLPTKQMATTHRSWLGKYMQEVNTLVEEVKPLAEKVAVNNQLVVMVVNEGQLELLMNFACAAQSRGLNVSNILVFVLGENLKEVVEGLGMTAYYNEEFLGSLPSNDAHVFGDKIFTEVVISKFICTHLLSIMGYDFLFQDVDIVWFRNPMEFFNDPKLADPSFDIYFQDDINNGIRYQPYRGNSGFYFVRHNERTVAAMKDAILKTDQLYAARSHQQTLLEVLSEHVTYHGLRVKTFDGHDTDYFPSGYHAQLNKAFMQAFFRGKKKPWIFHINWTKTKKEKIAYFQQIGEWFVNESCMNISSSNQGNAATDAEFGTSCCSTEALFTCHYRDKPSKKQCTNSPTSDGKNRTS